jgi:hypothetical protein
VTTHDLTHSSPHQLATLLNLNALGEWSTSDAAAILQHQLDAPLLPDLAQLPGAETDRLEKLLLPETTFLDPLTSSAPSTEVLASIKRFAQWAEKNASHPLHGTPATILYYAALAAATLHAPSPAPPITQLSLPEQHAGFHWAKSQPGAARLIPLFEKALLHSPQSSL